MSVVDASPVTASEAKSLFSDLKSFPALVLAVSGGPDSTALLLLAARWRDASRAPPKLIAVTVDHGLRKEAKLEAVAVARLARKLKVAHRTLQWRGKKPASGVPQAARAARYRLLSEAAKKSGAAHILTAHTLDDQAETVLIRMTRGSGITGLGAMQRISVIPGRERSERTRNPDLNTTQVSGFRVRGLSAAPRNDQFFLVRPLLDIPKARLIATLKAADIPFADDPSNRDPRFTRARLRGLLPQLAQEGLDARRLALLARRLRRADAAIEAMVEQAMDFLAMDAPAPHALAFEAGGFVVLPAEIALRLLGRAVGQVGDEGPVELAKLEALKDALDMALKAGKGRYRRSLAGALVTLMDGKIAVERAPARRGKLLTTGRRGRAKRPKSR
ncbi:MAG: tRNA lysidine(34) synthetase TilS [Rhizobiales bacterium]|nr:tRNA lysidine(34) synthetase TilS [Hyphomicrobiales bacterium]